MKKLLALLLIILCLSGCSVEQVNEPPHTQREEVIVAALDTGVSTTAIQSDSLLSGHNYVTDTDDTEDRINHGTAVVSVILGCKSAGIEAEELKKQLRENVMKMNDELPAYSRINDCEFRDEPFEKTPKQSIKRFMYQ